MNEIKQVNPVNSIEEMIRYKNFGLQGLMDSSPTAAKIADEKNYLVYAIGEENGYSYHVDFTRQMPEDPKQYIPLIRESYQESKRTEYVPFLGIIKALSCTEGFHNEY